MVDQQQQLTIVSNRLPVVLEHSGTGWEAEPGSGGLVQAMTPILTERGGRWVGWPGVTADDGDGWRGGLEQVAADVAYEFEPVILERRELEGYYEGFANSVLWPLFHGFPDRCHFEPDLYEAYGRVNQKFAEVIAAGDGDGFLWVHDYHLFEVARRLGELGHRGHRAFFLHIPFPSVENFSKLPWKKRLLADLLHYDVLGFQTERDVDHFRTCVDALGIAEWRADADGTQRFELGARTVEVGAFPISIDYREFADRAANKTVTRRIEALKDEVGPYDMILGVDRLDYSKGLLHRLQAYEEALEKYPDLREEVVFFQLVVPSREGVDEYQALKREFDRVVGRINGRFSTAGWQPIHYLYNCVRPVELSALYRAASVALVTPLRDGMNLVSKEYCASQVDEDGVLVLSEFAGAAEQLDRGAVLVNPYDTAQTAQAIRKAVTMAPEERKKRMKAMRQVVSATDVYWWANAFFERAAQRQQKVQQTVGSEVAPPMAGQRRRQM